MGQEKDPDEANVFTTHAALAAANVLIRLGDEMGGVDARRLIIVVAKEVDRAINDYIEEHY